MSRHPAGGGGPLLVATDRSAGAALAIERARRLAATTGRGLIVCHVLEDGIDGVPPPGIAAELEGEVPGAGVVMAKGRPFVEVIRAARERGAALIVAGAFGEHRSGDIPLGVTGDRLVRKADRPVLLVRGPVEGDYRSVVAGVDGSEESLAALHLALDLAPGAHLVAVRAFTPIGEHRLRRAGADREAVDAYRAAVGRSAVESLDRDLGSLAVERRVVMGRPEVALTEAAAARGAQLLAVGWRGANPLSHILLGSVAHHLAHEARCDLLVHRATFSGFALP